MNIREVLSTGQTKSQAMAIVDYIGEDAVRLKDLMDLLNGDDRLIAQRAAWPLMHYAERHPVMIEPFLPDLISLARKPNHPAVKRCVTRILDHSPLSEDVEGYAYELCHALAGSAQEDVAVRCFSLGVIEQTALKYVELIDEVLPIAEQMSQSDSAGMRSRGKKAVDRLTKSRPKA